MTARSRRSGLIVAVSIAGLLVAAGGVLVLAGALAPDPRETCAGIPRRVGGCDVPQPSFSAATCAGVGEEFGIELHRRGLAIIDGPASANGESRSVRLTGAIVLVVGRANQNLRDRGMVKQCGVDEFIAAAELQFSEPFKSRVGDYLFDGTERPYSEWLADLKRFARVIDMGEDEPFLPSAT